MPGYTNGPTGLYFDKAAGEFTLELPWEVQKNLAEKLRDGNLRNNVPDDFLKHTVPNNANDDVDAYFDSEDYPQNNVQRIGNFLDSSAPKLNAEGVSKISPEKIRVLNPGHFPNWSDKVAHFKTPHSLAGEVDAFVYRSKDKTLEYTVFLSKDKKAWIGNIVYSNSAINSAGLPSRAINGFDLVTPLWEYGIQLPHQFHGATKSGYVEAWNYIKEIPLISVHPDLAIFDGVRPHQISPNEIFLLPA